MPPSWQEIEVAFARASKLQGAERERYLDTLGAQLAAKVTSLLAADEADDDLLHRPIAESAQSLATSNDDRWEGQIVGAFRIERRIASGGMGAVFLAQRIDDAYDQQVAIKIMSAHLVQADAIDRFRVERQILANLRHPNIAQLLDGGSTDEKLPYLVMEYVEGWPVDEYVEAHELTVKQRLRLFSQICDAVDYAHRNLIVHRDLKPSNILVNSDGEVKLLDFGIAKLIDPSRNINLTQTGNVAMTLSYASPEQVRGESISVSSDVYALGVLLYYLLTGQSPYEVSSTSVHELQTSILEQEPRKPSTVVGTTTTSLQKANLNPQSVSRLLSGDLDNIVLMAIRKEVENRYATVRALRDDIEHYLGNRPVTAHKASWLYRGKKFLRRNAAATTAAALGLTTISALSIGFTLRLAQERDTAELERNTAEQVSAFVVDVFKTADPFQTRGEALTVRDALDSGIVQLEDELEDAPTIKSRILRAIADVYLGLGAYERTVDLAQQSVALQKASSKLDALELLDTEELLGDALIYLSDYEAALPVLSRVLEQRQQQLGSAHPDTINVTASLGMLYRRMGNPDKHLQTCEPAIGAARTLSSTAEKTWLLVCAANAYLYDDRHDEALALFEEAALLQKQAWGADDPTYLSTLSDMAIGLHRTHDERLRADALYTEVIEAQRRVLGPDHPRTADALGSRAVGRMLLADLNGAEADITATIALIQQTPSRTQELGRALTNAAKIKLAKFEMSAAIDLAEQAIANLQTNSEGTNEFLGTAYSLLARAHSNLGQADQADRYFLLSREEYEKGHGPDHPNVLRILQDQVIHHIQMANPEQAVEIALDLIARSERGGHNTTTHNAKIVAVGALNQSERYRQADSILATIRETVGATYGEESQEYAAYLSHSADTASGLGQFERSIETRARAIAQLSALHGTDYLHVGTLRVNQGKALASLNRLDEARTEVTAGLNIIVGTLGEDHSAAQRTRDVLASLTTPK